MIIQGKKQSYQVVIGLEVHAQINTLNKLFSSSMNNFGDEPNSNISFFDIAYPGTLPIVNKSAIHKTIATGLAISATINKISRFDRKHYFYPDLPSGYQITQMHHPIVENGYINITISNDNSTEAVKKIRVNRIHIEQDAGKSIHREGGSLIDYNRAGVPLMEIVSEPDLSSPDEAVMYLKKLQTILRYVNASDADLEKGTFRCDANVSIQPLGSSVFGTRCEIKNLNSFKFIAAAIKYEANRQLELIENGEHVTQQTRLFDQKKGITILMRDKADAVDYRYLPDSNFLKIEISDKEIEDIRSSLPELPEQKYNRYLSLGVSVKDATFLTSDPIYSDYFDIINQKHDVKMCITWMLNELLGQLASCNLSFEQNNITPEMLMELMALIQNGKINGKIGKEILAEMVTSGSRAASIMEVRGLIQIDDETSINEMIKSVIAANDSQFQALKNGNERMLGFFVGQVMKLSNGKANPAIVNKLLNIAIAAK